MAGSHPGHGYVSLLGLKPQIRSESQVIAGGLDFKTV